MFSELLTSSSINQILHELVEPDRYAQALREMFDWSLYVDPVRPRQSD